MKYLALIISFLFFLSCEKETVTKPKEDTKVELVYLDCNNTPVVEYTGLKAGGGGYVALFFNPINQKHIIPKSHNFAVCV